MVRAILDGRKTQTRRGFKLYKDTIWYEELGGEKEGWICGTQLGDGWCHVSELASPYGKPGDLLWVRETCAEDVIGSSSVATYKADDTYLKGVSGCYIDWWYSRQFCPSIHMPRWASRLTLEITDIRVERVQDITAKDAMSEGLKKWPHKNDFAYGYDGGASDGHGTPTGAFHALWNSLYSNWNENPWVFVISFNVIKGNVDEILSNLQTK